MTELYYWAHGDLYSHSYAALRLERNQILALIEDEWQPLLAYDVAGGWTRLEDGVPLTDLGVGRPPGRPGDRPPVELLLVDDRGLILARKRCLQLLSLFRHGSGVSLHLSLSADDRRVLPLARLERGRSSWVGLEHWDEASGVRGQIIVAGLGFAIPGMSDLLDLAALGPRSRLSGLAGV